MSLTDADLVDGVWEIVPEPNSALETGRWPNYFVVPCAKYEASAERAMLNSWEHTVHAPCGCVDRTLLGSAQLGGIPLACARSAHLMVVEWSRSGLRLAIRKHRGSRFAGEILSGGVDERVVGRFTLKPVALTPREPAEGPDRTLGGLAEPDAIDCGRATNDRSGDAVYDCAAAALAQHKAFFCRYSPPLPAAGAAPPTEKHAVWASPAAYVGMADGRVFVVEELPGKAPRRGDLVLSPSSSDQWRTLMPGMTPAALVRPDESRKVDRRVDGILIMEVVIGSDGSVRKAQFVKPLGLDASDVALQMVLEAKFVPSRFFGIPVTTVRQIGMRAANGRLTFGYSGSRPAAVQ